MTSWFELGTKLCFLNNRKTPLKKKNLCAESFWLDSCVQWKFCSSTDLDLNNNSVTLLLRELDKWLHLSDPQFFSLQNGVSYSYLRKSCEHYITQHRGQAWHSAREIVGIELILVSFLLPSCLPDFLLISVSSKKCPCLGSLSPYPRIWKVMTCHLSHDYVLSHCLESGTFKTP